MLGYKSLLAIFSCFLLLTRYWSLFLWNPWDRNTDPLSYIQYCPGTNNGAQCGYIEVPKDYTGQVAGFTLIAYARYPAKKRPSKGTIFLNPGGPGAPGKSMITKAGQFFAELLGDDWDLIGFDPRGVGETIPSVHCFSSPLEQYLFRANTVFEQGFNIPANVSDPSSQQSLKEQYRQWLNLKKTQAELCHKHMGDELVYSGTTTVAKDIAWMRSLMDPSGKINFWSGSYGSILGAYLVNMFPQEVGYVAIDGIADPILWSSEPSYKWPKQFVSFAEKTYSIFLSQCVEAGTAGCALAREGQSASDLEKKLDVWFDTLITDPLPVPEGSRPGYLTSGGARTVVFHILNQPSNWQKGASIIDDAMNKGNATAMYNILVPPPYDTGKPDISAGRDLARLAVSCLDSPRPSFRSPHDAENRLVHEGLKALRVSRFGMSTTVQEPDGGCEFWPVQPRERFTGPWNNADGKLEVPMLIITNTADPITPMSSALRINTLLPHSSRLIIYDAPGHGSLSAKSPCTPYHTKQYFAGVIPPNGTLCDSPGSMFPTTPSKAAEPIDADSLTYAAGKIGEVVFGWMNL